eukprot:gene10568-22055_t
MLRLDISSKSSSPSKSTGDSRPLSLDLGESMERSCSIDDMDTTYRQEGISVSHTRMRIEGEEIYMQVLEKDLVVEKRIGQGACSAVFRARHKRHGELYAIKMFNIFDRERRSQLQKEITMLSRIQCDSLIAFFGAYHKDGNIGVILEYMDKGSLEFILDKNIRITEEAMAGISYQIMWGLAYLHFEHNIHRDIKPGNVLMNSKGAVKLSDFGISRSLDSTQAMSSTSVGTFKYMSLERLLGTDYDMSSDIWSVGIMLIELWEKKYPLEECSSSPIELVQIIEETKNLKNFLVPSSSFPYEMQQFLQSLIDPKPLRRETASGCLTSSWFKYWSIDSLDAAQEVAHAWVRSLGNDDNESEPEEDFDMSMSMSQSFRIQPGAGAGKNRRVQANDYDDDYEADSKFEEDDEDTYRDEKSSGSGRRVYKFQRCRERSPTEYNIKL